MEKEFEILLRIIRNDFNIREAYHKWNPCLESDFFELVEEHKLTSLLFLKSYDALPGKLAERIKNRYRQLLQNHCNIADASAYLRDLAQKEGVHIIFIKGTALNADIYGAKPGHTSNDIDILVSEKDLKKLHAALLKQGYRQRGGMTSIGKEAGTYKRALLAVRSGQKPEDTPFPVKRSPGKPEYLPYVKEGRPHIEVHDGLYFWSENALNDALKNGCEKDAAEYWKFKPEYVFLLLLTNTFENSESFYSNTYDFGAVLRDYADLRFFLLKYENALNWNLIAEKIELFGLRKIVEIVLGNFREIYGEEISFGRIPKLKRADSEWKVSILERMQDNKLARSSALSVMRKRWREEGEKSVFKLRDVCDRTELYNFRNCITPREVKYNMERDGNALVLSWAIPEKYQVQGEKTIVSVSLFPVVKRIFLYFLQGGYQHERRSLYRVWTRYRQARAGSHKKNDGDLSGGRERAVCVRCNTESEFTVP